MRVKVSRNWSIDGVPEARLDIGQVFDVSCRLAMYLFALHCIEAVEPERVPLSLRHT